MGGIRSVSDVSGLGGLIGTSLVEARVSTLLSPVEPSALYWMGSPMLKARENKVSKDAVSALAPVPPVESLRYVTFGGTSRFRQAAMETAAMTILAIVRIPEATSGIATVCTNHNASTNEGICLFLGRGSTGAAFIQGRAGYATGAGSAAVNTNLYVLSGGSASIWKPIAMTLEPGVGIRMHDVANNSSSLTADTRTRALWSASMDIGLGPFNGGFDCAMFAVIPGALTAAQIATAFAKPRLYLAEIAGISA